MSGTPKPLARTNVTVKALADELLVYDLDSHQAACLNQTASLVWKYCDGTRDVSAITQAVGTELGKPVESGVVWYALKQLGDKELLQTRVTPPVELGRLTRRDFFKSAAIISAGVAIPVIVSLSAPKAADAASCLGSGSVCTSPTQCCVPTSVCPGVCS